MSQKTQRIMRPGLLPLMVLAALGAVGCGEGAVPPDTTSQAAATTPGANGSVVLATANPAVLKADGSLPVALSFLVSDPYGVVLEGRKVEVRVIDAQNAARFIRSGDGTSDSGGLTGGILQIPPGAEREITVQAATADSEIAKITIPVQRDTATGTTTAVVDPYAGQLSVRIGATNKVEDLAEQLSYKMPLVVVVSDSRGRPVTGASVTVTARPLSYRVGFWQAAGAAAASTWTQVYGQSTVDASVRIAAEQGSNASADLGKCLVAADDVNGDGVLTPGNVATVTTDARTNAAGLATIGLTYPKMFAGWVAYRVTASASVGQGTEGRNSIDVDLGVLGDDLKVVDGVGPPASVVRSVAQYSTATRPITFPSLPAGTNPSTLSGPFPYIERSAGIPTCP